MLKAPFLTSQFGAFQFDPEKSELQNLSLLIACPDINSGYNFNLEQIPTLIGDARHSDPGISTRERASHCEMNWKISSAISTFACLLVASFAALAQSNARQSGPQAGPQANAQVSKPVVYATAPKLAIAKLKSGESNPSDVRADVRGRAVFTLAAATNDDTVTGTLVYTIPDDARQKIAQLAGRPLNSIPASVARKDVIAGFQNGTACPVAHLEIGAMELDVAGAKLHFNRIVLDIIETAEEVPQHFCAWTRQINAKRQRRGIIASLNRLITGEQ